MKKICLKWINNSRIDILIWFIFLCYEIIVVGLITKNWGHPVTYLFHYAINIGVFYLHAKWLFPWAMNGGLNAIWQIPVVFAAEISIYLFLAFQGDVQLIKLGIITHVKVLEFNHTFLLTAIYRSMYFLGFATVYYFVVKYIRDGKIANAAEKRALINQHQTETELVKAQHAFLRAQINPHFLFNTLDFVYHNIEAQSEKAAEAIVLLSRMMRYGIMSEGEDEFILLEQEIEQVENLLYLHQLRKEEPTPIHLVCSDEVRELRFIPMVVLTLVENMLKHGHLDGSIEEAPSIGVFIEGINLVIETSNLIGYTQRAPSDHIGLGNISKRLNYYYGESATLSYAINPDGYFVVRITVPLAALGVYKAPVSAATNNGRLSFHEAVDQMQKHD